MLVEQVGKQIEADGGHAERSTHYHRYTLDFYLLALAIAQHTADPQVGAFADADHRSRNLERPAFNRQRLYDHARIRIAIGVPRAESSFEATWPSSLDSRAFMLSTPTAATYLVAPES